MTTGTDWLEQGRRLIDAFLQGATRPAENDAAEHRSDCTWCPLCQVAAVVRGERPEVSAALADVLDATATALRSFGGAAGDARTHTGRAADEGDPADGDPPPAVQRIEIA